MLWYDMRLGRCTNVGIRQPARREEQAKTVVARRRGGRYSELGSGSQSINRRNGMNFSFRKKARVFEHPTHIKIHVSPAALTKNKEDDMVHKNKLLPLLAAGNRSGAAGDKDQHEPSRQHEFKCMYIANDEVEFISKLVIYHSWK